MVLCLCPFMTFVFLPLGDICVSSSCDIFAFSIVDICDSSSWLHLYLHLGDISVFLLCGVVFPLVDICGNPLGNI